ncbi:metallophosphoesterase family protein [Maliponia aquimaris]|uniref:Putative metallophosphoesterase YhaO n=1 Tax=Maliponia aquimaris TaxID=1673631 RepID=A0A238KP27_9RHOB|nr:DNA repair exonuclease [Maliponia aquimaris]SMX44604.1 putative metallophosphoesterase YhaO [Maliponia aquimaris]
MPHFRFIHASDLHLGRRFANIPQAEDGNIRGRLMEARHMAIPRLARAARDSGAAHVLLAGDTFDTPTPSAGVLRQALAAMGDDPAIHWWLIPGNHDNLASAEPLWDRLAREAPANVHALTDTTPQPLAEGVHLLPCPVPHRNPGRDLTEALTTTATPDGTLRLALAHGGVTDFDESGAHIAPDRDRLSRLDYLALGDWHGRLAISPRTQFPGTPEQDRFKHNRRGLCLSVTLAGPGAPPEVTEIETGQFLWTESDLPLLSDIDAPEALRALLPTTGRRDILQRVHATGWAGLAQRAALEHAAADAAPDFALLELTTDRLGALHDTPDLDAIDRGGALRQAAEALRDAAADPDRAAEDRAIAAEALARLFAYVTEPAS